MMKHAKTVYNGWSLSTVNLPFFHYLVGLSPRLDGGVVLYVLKMKKEFTVEQNNS